MLLADRAGFVDRLADHVHDAAQRGGADRNANGGAGIDHFLATGQALGRVHGDGAHGVLTQMLGDFEHQPDFLAGLGVLVLGLQRVENGGQFALEFHVDDGADDLAEFAFGVGHDGLSFHKRGREAARQLKTTRRPRRRR